MKTKYNGDSHFVFLFLDLFLKYEPSHVIDTDITSVGTGKEEREERGRGDIMSGI
jgi:hypothetical protein